MFGIEIASSKFTISTKGRRNEVHNGIDNLVSMCYLLRRKLTFLFEHKEAEMIWFEIQLHRVSVIHEFNNTSSVV